MRKVNELDSTSIARIKPPKQVSEPVYFDIRDLESFQEIEQAKQREQTKKPPHDL